MPIPVTDVTPSTCIAPPYKSTKSSLPTPNPVGVNAPLRISFCRITSPEDCDTAEKSRVVDPVTVKLLNPPTGLDEAKLAASVTLPLIVHAAVDGSTHTGKTHGTRAGLSV